MAVTTRRILAAIPALLFAATLSIHAQKPALTKSVDEPGRTPYSDVQTCPNNGFAECFLVFKGVPAGYRLVVTYVTVLYPAPNGTERLINLEDSQGGVNSLYLPAGNSVAGNRQMYVVSTPVTFYINGGLQPIIDMLGIPNSPAIVSTLVGYLVAIP